MSEKYLLRSTPSALRRIALTLVLIFAATTALIYSGWFQIGADAGWGLFRDVNRKVHVAFGWTLPGTPDLGRLKERLTERGVALGAPVFMRIFKQEYELE
ncbi:MAG: hypothetical protein H7X92_12725, partial [Chitinophagales bacterium]|nr:hypothetical protein [Hyphomicrobiales bacterium]